MNIQQLPSRQSENSRSSCVFSAEEVVKLVPLQKGIEWSHPALQISGPANQMTICNLQKMIKAHVWKIRAQETLEGNVDQYRKLCNKYAVTPEKIDRLRSRVDSSFTHYQAATVSLEKLAERTHLEVVFLKSRGV